MKKLFVVTIFFSVAASAAFAQSFSAPMQKKKAVKVKPPPPITARDISGVIPRAIRGGNPVQMLNPRAPAKYGTAAQSVLLKPDGSGKWNGIKLFTIYF